MANSINWGKIYETTYWGIGVSTNTISWGKVYEDLMSGASFSLDFDKIATDFTFTRNSFATRVNEFGLIETVTDLGPDVVQNGNFEELGSENITNGSFDTDTDWNKGSGVTISGGSANFTGVANAGISQSAGLVTGKTYKIVFTVSNYVSGNIDYNIGGATRRGDISANGTYTDYVESSSGVIFYFQSDQTSGFVGSIDNVSIKQVDPNDDWSFGNVGGTKGWRIADGRAICDEAGVANGRNLDSSFVLTSGVTYKLTLDILQSADNIQVFIGGTLLPSSLPTGTNLGYEYIINGSDHTGGILRIYAGSSDTQEIDNISVQEVLEDDIPRIDYTGSTFDIPVLGSELVTNGTFDTDISGWIKGSGTTNPISWDSGKMKVTNDVALQNSARQTVTTVIGKTYLVTANVDSTNGVNPRLATSNPTTAIIGTGGTIETLSYTFVATSTFSEISLYNWQNTLGAYNLWDNVSVKEVTAYTTTDKGSFLLEPASTNLIPYSEDFSSLNTRSNAVVTSNQIISPSGLLDADEITFDGTATGRVEASVSVIVGQPYTISLYLKNKDLSDVTQVWIGFSDASQGQFITITDEWQRYDITTNADGTTEYPRIQFGGTGSLYAWGFQTEQQSYATSYIPTNGSVVTRAQESCVNATPTINSLEGVLYWEASALAEDGTNRYITLSNGTVTNRLITKYGTSDVIQLVSANPNGGANMTDLSGTDILTNHKIAFRYETNNYAIFIDGVKVDEDLTSGTFDEGILTKLSFSNSTQTGQNFYGNTKDLKIYDKALTDEQLTELTTI